jgi:hypothetical protein
VSDIDLRLKRVNNIFDRVSNTPKPKAETEKTGKKKNRKMPKNIKIDNMTFDGNSDMNWDDFITMNNGGDEDSDYFSSDDNTQQQ